MRSVPLLVGSLSIVAIFIFSPQSRAETKTLSWNECVRLATDNSAALQAAKENLRSSEAQVGASRSGYFPTLSASVGGTRQGGTNSLDPGTSYNAGLTLSENLFSGLNDLAKVRQSQANVKAAEASLKSAKAALSYNLKVQFEGLRYAEDAIALAQQIIARRESDLKLVELRFDGGQENKGSVLLSQAYLEDAKYGLLQAQDAKSTAIESLKDVLGSDDLGDLNVSGQVPVRAPDQTVDFRKLAVTTPDELQAVAKEKAADAGVTLARSGFFPKLDLTGLTERKSQEFFPQGNDWQIGVTLTLPLFDGGKDYYSTQAASDTWRSAQHNFHEVHRATVAKLRQVYNAYVEAVAKLKVDTAYRKEALVRSEIARNQYNNGLISFTDWDLIENDLINRERSYLQSQRDRVVNEAAWEQALGEGVIP